MKKDLKVDLKDAYFGVSLHRKHQKCISFRKENQLCKFLCRSFGLGPAPQIFTKLLKIPKVILRRINIRIIVYLDSMLLISQTIWFALTTVGAHNKFEKVSTISDPEIGIIGARNRLSHHDFNLINGKVVTESGVCQSSDWEKFWQILWGRQSSAVNILKANFYYVFTDPSNVGDPFLEKWSHF